MNTPKPNDLCPCGSELKYKKCCFLKPEEKEKAISQRQFDDLQKQLKRKFDKPMTMGQFLEFLKKHNELVETVQALAEQVDIQNKLLTFLTEQGVIDQKKLDDWIAVKVAEQVALREKEEADKAKSATDPGVINPIEPEPVKETVH
jgi:hypothetical protein